MPIYPGFIGPGYLSQSAAADGEVSRNFYCEKIESGHGKGGADLYLVGTPGLKLVCTLPTSPGRGMLAGDNRLFAVAGDTFYEVFADGSYTASTGSLGAGDSPVTIIPNGAANGDGLAGSQLAVLSNQNVYVQTGAAILGPYLAASSLTWLDTYFIAQLPNSNRFQLSAPYDGTSWDPLDYATKEGAADRLVMVYADHSNLYLFGEKTTEPWQDTGASNFPFQKVPGAFIEQGLYAPFSVAKLDNAMFFLGGDDRGAGVVWKVQGYIPQRVSNHAVEQAIQKYKYGYNAVACSYQENGHSFYQISFTSDGVTWVYDTTLNMWHERRAWDTKTAKYSAHWGVYHAFTLGKHFVQDYRNGNIYEMSSEYYDDDGTLIRRERSAPHIVDEAKWMRHKRMQVDMQVGRPSNISANPQVMMQMSNDGGNTWGNEHWVSAGKLGEYRHRAIWNRLGASRDRCYRVVITEPMQVALINAYLDVSEGRS